DVHGPSQVRHPSEPSDPSAVPDPPAALARAGEVAAVGLAAEAVGAADFALSSTVEYVQAREQFGRPVGSFQAVKHRLADLYVQVQSARSAAYYAAWAAGRQDPASGDDPGGLTDPGDRIGVAGPLALAQAL